MSDTNGEKSKNGQLPFVLGGCSDLMPFTEIKAPDEASKKPSILSFRRKREVDIPWMDILNNDSVKAGSKPVDAIRNYFESSWGLEIDESEEIKKTKFEKIQTGNSPLIQTISQSSLSNSASTAIIDAITKIIKILHVSEDPNCPILSYSTAYATNLPQKLKSIVDELVKIKEQDSSKSVIACIEMIEEMVTIFKAQMVNTTNSIFEQAIRNVIAITQKIKANKDKFPLVFRAQFRRRAYSIIVDKGFVIRHGSGRLYLLIDSVNNPLDVADFSTYEKYQKAWSDKIQGIELIFESPIESKNFYMDFEEIDLRPVHIERNYQRLRILHEFAKKVKEDVSKRVNSMIEKIDESALNAGELEQLQNRVLKLEMGAYDAEARIKRLVSTAERLGYVLCTDAPSDVKASLTDLINHSTRELEHQKMTDIKPPINLDDAVTAIINAEDLKVSLLEKVNKKFAGPPSEPIPEPGNIYTTYQRTAKWNAIVPTEISVTVGYWFWKHKVKKTVEVACPMETVVSALKKVETSKDLVEEKRMEFVKANMMVFVFKKMPSGFVSTEGIPLHQIMDQCRFDEEFRRKCVIMLPVYEESMTGQRLVIKYSIFKRPLPGIIPTIMPRLSLEESLSYRTAWQEMQLGEMVSSINLAPGEERQVKITKNYEQETTLSRTSSSIFDVSKTDSSDLASEMENQARQEQESSKHMEFSTKASGSYCGFSAEASASGGVKNSLKDMNQSISKVAKKAAQSVSTHNKQEVSSSSTSRTKITNIDETTATIRNINQGRSLNLFFYRIYNKYIGGLYLEDLRFDIIKSTEAIAGSGVHEAVSYGLDQLSEMINEFKSAQLPFTLNDKNKYTSNLCVCIEDLLKKEYMVPLSDSPNAKPIITIHKKPPLSDKLKQLNDELREAIINSDTPIAPQTLMIAAPGLYLDAVIGSQPSTEPYSELMRAQEVQMKQAEVFLKKSEGFSNQAKAAAQLATIQNESGNCITGILPDPTTNQFMLSLKSPLPSGDWELVFKDGKIEEVKAKIDEKSFGHRIIRFCFPAQQENDWLKKQDLETHIELVNRSSNDIIVQNALSMSQI